MCVAALGVVGLSACATVDLRPEGAAFDPAKYPADEGRAWLERAAEGAGGFERYRAAGNVRIVFEDEWPSWLFRTFGSPWESEHIQIDTRLGTDDGRVTFLDGAKRGWGVQRWVTYAFDEEGLKIDDDPEFEPSFWVPTTLYFPQAVFRLLEADVIHFVGTRDVDGRVHAGVFVSWGKAEPQGDIDQYVAWIDVQTKLLGWLEYTVRDYGDSFKGTMRYRDYRDVGGLKIPFRLTVVPELGNDDEMGLHEYRYESVTFGHDWPKSYLYPAPDRRGSK